MLLKFRSLRIAFATCCVLVVIAARAHAGDSVFDKLRRHHATQSAAEAQTLAQPQSEVQSLSTPPVAKRLEAERRAMAEEAIRAEATARAEKAVREEKAIRPASAQMEIDDSPFLEAPLEDFSVPAEPPVAVEVETEVIEDDFGVSDEWLETEEDIMHKPRLIDCLREMCTFAKRPMQGQSWLSRPLSVGLEFGGIWGGELIDDRVKMTSGTLFMGTFGFDRGNYDGYEVRIGGSTIDTFNKYPPLDPRNTRLTIFDFSALLYPWGDSRLRPFGRFGIGLHRYDFVNDEGREIENIIPAGLIGIGVKYLFDRHVAVRMEFIDNIGWGDGLDLEIIHSPSLTFGAEFRFGGHQKLYWPWQSGRMIW